MTMGLAHHPIEVKDQATYAALCCHRNDLSTVHYKLSGLPEFMRADVVQAYSAIYQTGEEVQRYYPNEREGNPVLKVLARRQARQRANDYLQDTVQYAAGFKQQTACRNQANGVVTYDGYTPLAERLRQSAMLLFHLHKPEAALLTRAASGGMDTDTEKELRRQWRQCWKLINDFCQRENISKPNGAYALDGTGPRHRRLCSPQWWQGQASVRKQRAAEHFIIKAGKVGKVDAAIGRSPYISDFHFSVWQQQQQDSEAYIADTILVSEDFDEADLSDIIKAGNANPNNRKLQYATMVGGMVRYAEQHNYQFLFITPTAASEHHRYTTKGGKVEKNPRYNPKWTPKSSHKHLSAIFDRVRSALARKGIEWFAVKGVEAHKDATPHWHMAFFYQGGEAAFKEVRAVFRWYFLEVDKIIADVGKGAGKQRGKITRDQWQAVKQHLRNTQPNALKKRVDFVKHDPSKGATIASYIMKNLSYVMKNLAGDTDMNDPKAVKQAQDRQRVNAWASFWGIRQIQFMRSEPVGVYQQLRRIRQPVEGSSQLEQERLACVGTYGTESHENEETRVVADFCQFMELRRGKDVIPVKPMKRVRVDAQGQFEVNRWGEQREYVAGLRSESEGLEVDTKRLRWKTVNTNAIASELIRTANAAKVGHDAASIAFRAENTRFYQDLIQTARDAKTVHHLLVEHCGWQDRCRPAASLSARAQPVATWKIKNNPTFLGKEGESPPTESLQVENST